MGVEVRVDRLTKSFGGKPVWSDVTLALPAGEISVLLGPSGTGKHIVTHDIDTARTVPDITTAVRIKVIVFAVVNPLGTGYVAVRVPADLAVVIDEIGAAFEGGETAPRTILDAGELVLDDAVANLGAEHGRAVPHQRDGLRQAESAEMIRRWAAGLARLAETVRASDGDLRRVLANGPPAAAELVALLDGLEPAIGAQLGNLTGLVLGPDGRPVRFGGTGGQCALASDQSWKQPLLAGVTS